MSPCLSSCRTSGAGRLVPAMGRPVAQSSPGQSTKRGASASTVRTTRSTGRKFSCRKNGCWLTRRTRKTPQTDYCPGLVSVHFHFVLQRCSPAYAGLHRRLTADRINWANAYGGSMYDAVQCMFFRAVDLEPVVKERFTDQS